MTQRPFLNRNQNFQLGTTVGFTENLTSATGTFLNRLDPRDFPARRVFPNKTQSTDYILNGGFSRRYSIASSGDVELVMEADPKVAVDPGMTMSIGLVRRYNATPAVETMEIRCSDAGGTPVAYAVLSVGARHVAGKSFVYEWQLASGNINLRDANQPAFEYWTGIGFQVDIPLEATFLTATYRLTSPASATVLDVGEFSIVALDSIITAIG